MTPMVVSRCCQTVHSAYRKGFFALLSANFLAQFLGFGTTLLVAKFLPPAQLGDIRILQSYALLFVIVAGFGYNTAALKFCSEPVGQQQRHSLLSLALRRSLVSSALMMMILLLLAASGTLTQSPRLGRWLLVYAAAIPLAVLAQLLMAYLQALKQITEMARVQGIVRAQSFLLIVVATWLWGFPGFVLATVASYALGLLPLVWQVGAKTWFVKASPAPGGFDRMAVFSMLGNGVMALGGFGQFFLLDHFWSDRDGIGYYSLATIFILGATQINATVQTIATPYLSERCSDRLWFRRTLMRVQVQLIIVAVGVAIAVYGAAWLLVAAFYGPGYQISLVYLAILLLTYVLRSGGAVIGVAMLALNKVHLNFAVATISTFVGLVLSYLMLKRYGLFGMAWAQVGADVVYLFLTLANAWRVLRNDFVSEDIPAWLPSPHGNSRRAADLGAEKRCA